MWDWIGDNVTELNLVFNGAMLLVWMAYLQTFLESFRRANRAVIHIGVAAQRDEEARCLVANMGSEAVYLLGVKVHLDVGEGKGHEALVTDRLEEDGPLGGDFRAKTSQGPLKAGEVLDIGSFSNIARRASWQVGEDLFLDGCKSIEITVVVAAQQAHRLMGGYKRFEITRGPSGGLRFRSDDVLTRQIKRRSRRRALAREIGG